MSFELSEGGLRLYWRGRSPVDADSSFYPFYSVSLNMGPLTTPPPFLPVTVNGRANSAFGLTGVECNSVGLTFVFGRWGASLPPSTFASGHGVQLPSTTPSGTPRASYKSRSPRGSLASLSDATNWFRSPSDPPAFSRDQGSFPFVGWRRHYPNLPLVFSL